MRAVTIRRPGELEIIEVERKEIETKTQVKVKIKSVGICGSDIGIYKGTNPMVEYPRIIGHEMAGEVIEIGEDVNEINIGDYVVIDPVIPCGHCKNCERNRSNVCENLQVMGVHIDGGFQDEIVVDKKNVYKVNKSMPWDMSVLIEPMAVGFQANSRARITSDDTVFVMGAGSVGQTVARVASFLGAKVFSSDVDSRKLSRAEKYGSIPINVNTNDANEFITNHNDGKLADVVVDAICTPKSFEEAVKSVKIGGRVVSLGFSEEASKIQSVDITSKELDILGSRLNNNKFPDVIKAYSTGRPKFDDLISHRMKFENIQEAFDLILDPSVYTEKIILYVD